MIEDSFKNRKHVVNYDQDIIPTREQVEGFLQRAYPLVTSKQKGYPYQAVIYGPNKTRSEQLWQLCEGEKVDIDLEINTDGNNPNYVANPGLFHVKTAPWTIIYQPRIAPPNPWHRAAFGVTNSKWQLDDPDFINRQNRESCAIEIGMLAKLITGAALEAGWDSSYNICFPTEEEAWDGWPGIKFVPTLIQTLGKGKDYKWNFIPGAYPSTSAQLKDTDAPFEEIFKFEEDRTPSEITFDKTARVHRNQRR